MLLQTHIRACVKVENNSFPILPCHQGTELRLWGLCVKCLYPTEASCPPVLTKNSAGVKGIQWILLQNYDRKMALGLNLKNTVIQHHTASGDHWEAGNILSSCVPVLIYKMGLKSQYLGREAGRSLSLWPTWSIEWVSGQSGLSVAERPCLQKQKTK